MTKKLKDQSGFTLAEILITLSIIGVIAAMVIPSLISDTNDAELHTKWKKSFADISNATRMYKTLHGDIDFTSHNTMRDSYEKILQFVRKDICSNLFASKYLYYKNTQGQGWDASLVANPSAIINNGNIILFSSTGNNGGIGFCSKQYGSLTGVCGWIGIDTNGKKGPNMYGKDFFESWVVKKGGQYLIFPIGGNGDGYTCINGSSNVNTSDGCAAMSLYNSNMP